MLDISISILFVILGFVFIAFQANVLGKLALKHLRLLWCFHLLFSLIFYVYTRSNPADVNGYWRVAKESSLSDLGVYLSKGLGTNVMYLFNYIPAHMLDLSIFSGIVIYAFLSFLGIYYIYKIYIDLVPTNTNILGLYIFPLVLFLPSLHFWSAGPGKDALLFLSIYMFGYALIKIKARLFLVLMGAIITVLIRPHILIILFASFGFAHLFSMNVNVWKRIFIFIFLAGVSIILLPTVLKYVSLDGLSIESTLNRLDSQANSLSGDAIGSSLNIQSYSLPAKIFTFLFRPLFFDSNGAFMLVASLENALLLFLTIKAFSFQPIQTYRNAPVVVKSFFIFLVLGAFLFSYSLSNFGIILRMKNMFVPALILYLLWALSFKNKIKRERMVQSNNL